jgi:hypothetical protein
MQFLMVGHCSRYFVVSERRILLTGILFVAIFPKKLRCDVSTEFLYTSVMMQKKGDYGKEPLWKVGFATEAYLWKHPLPSQFGA